ncbi:cyclase family protein [Candidatus Pantoea formicae]|uniref:cyclase family protein n=1 Tax=Candidatus Pantoea formicae TaxID=2608355 RepID=UPI003EDB0715
MTHLWTQLRNSKLIELNHLHQVSMPVWPTHPKFTVADNESYQGGDGNYNCQLVMGDHCGTHVDSPSHFIEGGKTIEQIDVRQLIGRGLLLDMRSTAPRTTFGVEEIQKWEQEFGQIEANDIVIFRTGWHEKWALKPEHSAFLQDWPGLSAEGATYLIGKGVQVFGTDALSLDAFGNEGNPVHLEVLGNDKLIIENLANLQLLPPCFTFIALPLRIAHGSASPVRAIALVED